MAVFNSVGLQRNTSCILTINVNILLTYFVSSGFVMFFSVDRMKSQMTTPGCLKTRSALMALADLDTRIYEAHLISNCFET